MSLNSTGSDWTFYLLGAMMVVLGISFILIPLLARSGTLSNIKIPWILLYTYNKNGFFFATSPILVIISLVGILVSILRH